MARKYQIVYDSYACYEKKKIAKHFLAYLFPLLLCIIFISYLAHTEKDINIPKLLMPGDASITTAAFQQLTEAIKSGETLSEALDVFCETVMEHQ